MRALGYVFTPLSAILWGLTILACGVIYLAPQLREVPMPYYGGTLMQFFLDFSVPMVVALVIMNGLSGRWGPEHLRRLDLWPTRLGLLTFIVICLAMFVGDWGREGLSQFATLLPLGLLAFALYDYLVNQGEDWRSSSLRGAQVLAANTAAAAAALTAATAAPAAVAVATPAAAPAVAPPVAPAPVVVTTQTSGSTTALTVIIVLLLFVLVGGALLVFGGSNLRLGLAEGKDGCTFSSEYSGTNAQGIREYRTIPNDC